MSQPIDSIDQAVQGHGRFEKLGGYARVRRVGAMVYVAGTTAIEPSGRLHAPNDTYAQTRFTLDRIAAALSEVGADIAHVVRTRAYLYDLGTAADFARAHGEVFASILPVTTAVQAGLTTPGMMVEIEVEAIVRDLAAADGRPEPTV
ncbi:Rid family hydrolase [Nocardioides terrisoli]|uniref:Rid family hydrolase n=1 Tax=Nocardioides terrisoli TaxID=3388267 RepID=UPI00287B61CD|nr:Rid family hydrolase [Nocardioides marmorisolisilvae]